VRFPGVSLRAIVFIVGVNDVFVLKSVLLAQNFVLLKLRTKIPIWGKHYFSQFF
jgi:hypothetical protein